MLTAYRPCRAGEGRGWLLRHGEGMFYPGAVICARLCRTAVVSISIPALMGDTPRDSLSADEVAATGVSALASSLHPQDRVGRGTAYPALLTRSNAMLEMAPAGPEGVLLVGG